MSPNFRTYIAKTVLIILSLLFILLGSGCPEDREENAIPDEPYRIGTWAGTVKTEARLILLQYPMYYNMAWRVEADIRLDEFQNGTLRGKATGDLFYWHTEGDSMLDYEQIANGRWDQYVTFEIDITGTVDGENYHLLAGELPVQIPDPSSEDGAIDFWDFLYPEKIDGRWDESGSGPGTLMEGQSLRVQGDDYRETAQASNFREFGITYNWSIRKL